MLYVHTIFCIFFLNWLFNCISFHKASSMSIDVNGPEPLDDVPEWKGVSMDEIRKGLGVYDSQELPPICPSPSHIVLISVWVKLNKYFSLMHMNFNLKII